MSKRALIWAAVSTRPQADEEEKFSIPKQIEDGEAMCKREGWQIVDILKVPGHSRDYRTLEQLAAAARTAKPPIDAFDRLIQHFERCDFDVFICRDANRFARKASLLHYIAEMIVEDCGATIYSMNDNMFVNAGNLPMWATLQGYKVRAEVTWLVSATRDGLIKRAERGLTTTHVPFSHKLIYDEKHKVIGIELDNSKRRLFDDLAHLIVEERMPFNGIEKVLYERFGHVADDGLPYGDNVMYYFLYSPLTWGTSGYGFNRKNGNRNWGTWAFDEDVPPPAGAVLFPNTAPAAYAGDQAEHLKAELRRRSGMRGGRRPGNQFAFSGLFVCDECRYTLTVKTNPRASDGVRIAYALHCGAQAHKFQHRPECHQTAYVPISYIRSYIDELLRRALETRDLSEILPVDASSGKQLAQAKTDADNVQIEMDNLVALQGKAHPGSQASYQKRIDALGERKQILDLRITELQAANKRYEIEAAGARAVLDDIEPLMDEFWSRDEATINQLLHRLMGTRRFTVLDGKITSVSAEPRLRQRRKPNTKKRDAPS